MARERKTFTLEDIQRMPTYTTEQLKQRMIRNVFAKAPSVDDSRYGESQKSEIDGTKVTVNYGGQSVQYLVPRDYAWTAGVGAMTIGKAFRLFNEGQETEHLREVREPSELESVASGYVEKIWEILKKNK